MGFGFEAVTAAAVPETDSIESLKGNCRNGHRNLCRTFNLRCKNGIRPRTNSGEGQVITLLF